jgi:hypothetical protein
MRKGVAIGAAVALALGTAWWWRWREAPAPSSACESDVQARERFERLRAQLNATLSAPLPSPTGELEISGQVIGPGGLLPGAAVTATMAEPGETLFEPPCRLLKDDPSVQERVHVDVDGHFVIRGLQPGAYLVHLVEPPERTRVVFPVEATIAERGTANVVLAASAGGTTLRVRVRSAGPDDRVRTSWCREPGRCR